MYFVMWIWDWTYLGSLCVRDLVELGLSGVCVAGWSRPVVLQPATRTPIKPSRTKSLIHNEPRYEQSQIHITKYINNAPNYQSTNEIYYTKENTMTTKHKRKRSISRKIHLPTTTKRQSTSHQTHTTKHHKCTLTQKSSVFTEHNIQCGNSTAESQAPDDGYINVRNMLNT